MVPFAYCLHDYEINAQYIMPDTLEQNGVAESWNRTFMDIFRSMMSTCNFSESLLGEALKTTTYILDRVSSKSVLKMPFELWTRRKPSLSNFCILDCPTKMKIYNPQLKKKDPRPTSYYFVGYPDIPKGYIFYLPSRISRLLSPLYVKFFENNDLSWSKNSEK